MNWLKDLAQANRDNTAGIKAIKIIARDWANNAESLFWLKELVQDGNKKIIRKVAVQELARFFKEDSELLPIFKNIARSDKYSYVRKTAVQELARNWKDDPDTIPILTELVNSDEDWDVRATALQELAHGWKDESWIFEFLYNRVLNDPFERKEDSEDNPRQLALEIIIKQYRDHPQTLPLLQDRAKNDSDEKVREFVQKKLAELEK